MKTIHAIWEERNLGIHTLEITFENETDIAELKKLLSTKMQIEGPRYLVVKVPVGDVKSLICVKDLGFDVIEMITTVSISSIPELSRVQQRFYKQISSQPMSSFDFEKMISNVSEGLFDTDRVTLDPKIPDLSAKTRFSGWMKDEQARGSSFYKILYKNMDAGFFVLSPLKDGKITSVLAGIYTDFQRYTIGYFMNHLAYEESFKLGARQVFTSFSSNNRGASSIHYSIACSLHNQYYVLTKID